MKAGKKGGLDVPLFYDICYTQSLTALDNMIVLEAKLQGTKNQYERLDEAIRTSRFIRNSCLRYWMDRLGKSRDDVNKYCKVLPDNSAFPWAAFLNSMARQAMAQRAWAAIARFYDNCKKKIPGKKGYPKFNKHQTRASVEHKTSGWKLEEDRRHITFKDGFNAGKFKLWGTRDLHFYQIEQIKRLRVVFYVGWILRQYGNAKKQKDPSFVKMRSPRYTCLG